jgi:small ligand-binding sensory domain FIST
MVSKNWPEDAIFLGVAMNEFQEKFVDGDFLVRNIFGIEPMSGALLVGEVLRSERTVQFHLRDAATSRDDLRAMLKRYIDKFGLKGQWCLAILLLRQGDNTYMAALITIVIAFVISLVI